MQDLRASDPDSIVARLEAEMQDAVGDKAPAVSFEDIADSGSETLQDYAGNTVVVNFWKTDCSGCRAQLPDLSKLHDTFKDRGLRVIYISPEREQKIKDFLAEREIDGLPRKTNPQDLERPYQLIATPSAYVVDAEGTIQSAWMGPETFEKLRERVAPYVGDRD